VCFMSGCGGFFFWCGAITSESPDSSRRLMNTITSHHPSNPSHHSVVSLNPEREIFYENIEASNYLRAGVGVIFSYFVDENYPICSSRAIIASPV